MLTLYKVSKRYSKSLFSSFSYQFEKGKIYCIIGPSGCGKSTLLSMIANKTKNYKGNIYYKNTDIRKLNNYTFLNVSYVYQDYQLFDNLTALENIVIHFKLNNIDYNPYIYKIKTLLKQFDVFYLLNEKVKYMSGGEKQRIAIVKALIKDSNILLFDEPTSALDSYNANLFLTYLNKIKKDKIIIMVTHDINLANKCDEIIDFNNLKNSSINSFKVIKQKEEKIKFAYLGKLYKKVLASNKVFSYLSTAILSFGLISISLSFVIKDFINEIVSSSFSMFNTNTYVTIKAKDEKSIVDFSTINLNGLDYIYYEGIASEDKIKIKEQSLIDSVYLNNYKIDNTSFVFDNYLSHHKENICLYVPKNINAYIGSKNFLTINYLDKIISINIDNVFQSSDDNFYIYCNNFSYLYRYFLDNNIEYDVYKYYYSEDSKLLYEYLCKSYLFKDYLFYYYLDNNMIQIVQNNYSRITKDIFIYDFIYCDYIHTYIDYDTGLIYLLDDNNYQVIIDETISTNKLAITSKINTSSKTITIFDKEYEIESIKSENNYSIIYMNKETFQNLNDPNLMYVGIINKKDMKLIQNNEYIMVNNDLFDANNIPSFEYISKFIFLFSMLLMILAILSTITIFNINFIGKKKDYKLLSNMGIYDNKVLNLMIKEPLNNIIYCSLYGAFFYIFSSLLISIMYQILSSVNVSINVSITIILSLLIIPCLIIMPLIISKSYTHLKSNIKK